MKNGKMMKCLSISRSSHQIYSLEKAVLKIFANVTGKHLRWSLFLMKSYAVRPATLLKRDYKIDFFFVKFAKFLRTPISKNICERLLCISYDSYDWRKQSEPLANFFVDLFTIFWVSFILMLFRWKGIRPGGC